MVSRFLSTASRASISLAPAAIRKAPRILESPEGFSKTEPFGLPKKLTFLIICHGYTKSKEEFRGGVPPFQKAENKGKLQDDTASSPGGDGEEP